MRKPKHTVVIKKRSLSIRGHRTSVSMEDAFWDALVDCSKRAGLSQAEMVARIDAERAPDENLSSAIRVFLLKDLQADREH